MKMIVGLGNPGDYYENTRHNIGFMVLDNYLKDVNWQKKHDALIFKNENVIFVKPQTYMNLSGNAVVKLINYYKIELEDVLIIHDDLDIELGSYKLKTNSGSGGNNGVQSIINSLKTQELNRLKIGISNNKMIDTKDYVLTKLSKKDKELLENVFESASSIIDTFISEGMNGVMNKHSTGEI